jgi:hypothetical protein
MCGADTKRKTITNSCLKFEDNVSMTKQESKKDRQFYVTVVRVVKIADLKVTGFMKKMSILVFLATRLL